MEGTCNPDNLWDGCAFNFAYNQEMRQMQFSNEGWDLKWYPFDSRVLYIKIRLHKDQRKVFYKFPEMPRAMQIGRSVGWTLTSPMTCVKQTSIESRTLMEIFGARCEFSMAREPTSVLVLVLLPMALSMVTVFLTFFAPVGAAMPRVAVTALAYVGMGATLNALGGRLPNTGSTFTWLHVVVFNQLMACVSGTGAHMVLFYLNAKEDSQAVEKLNTTMRYFIPLAYLSSFVNAQIEMLVHWAGVIFTLLAMCIPPIIMAVHFGLRKRTAESDRPGQAEQVALVPTQKGTKQTSPGDIEMSRLDQHSEEFEDVVRRLFVRYSDTKDEAGVICDSDELTQFTIALIFKLGVMQNPGDLDGQVSKAIDASRGSMSLDAVKAWFIKAFMTDKS